MMNYAKETITRHCYADIKEMPECDNFKPGIPERFCRHLMRYSQECKAPRGEVMKANDVKCKKCGGKGQLHGSDHTNEFGPFYIACIGCGEETVIWAYPREAWQAWKRMNR